MRIDMNRVTNVMSRILAFEMKRINNLDFRTLAALPPYSDRKRGPLIVAYWREQKQEDTSFVIVQVCLGGCMGGASVCANGILVTPTMRRPLLSEEMYAYY